MNKQTLIVTMALAALVGVGIWQLSAQAQCNTDKPAATSAPAGVAVVNIKCPIMGGAINQKCVPANLVREYKGQKVGFCCAGCPAAWDKLSDADKDAKLAKVMPEKK